MGAQESTVDSQCSGPPLQRQPSYDRMIRLCVVGCAASTRVDPLINEFIGYGYKESLKTNLMYDFKTHRITVDGERFKVQVWNVYGVKYYGLSPVLFRAPLVGLMLLYDVGEERSFERAKELITGDIQQMSPNTSIVLVGCHYQQEKKKREVTYCRARDFADERDIPVIEIVCGKEGVNVEFAFMTLVAAILSKQQM